MEYIHIRNLEKYHPGYKDRELKWAKIYFMMAQGDPDCELIEDEIDWARLIKIILLELEAKTPLPNLDRYWTKKGFNVKKRPMSLTIKMLHNFIEVVTQDSKLCALDKDKDKDKEKIVVTQKPVTNSHSEESQNLFETSWIKYPAYRRKGKQVALKRFNQTVTAENEGEFIKALENYLKSDNVKKGYVLRASKWFSEWQDWVEVEPPPSNHRIVKDYTYAGRQA